VTKVARSTIGRGLKDLRDLASLTGEVRRKGGGSPRLTTRDPTLLEHLQRLLEPATMGDPMRPLRWVSKSHDKLATALREMGHKVSSSTIPKLLEELKYCRHYNRKTKEGGKHPDRDAQFEYINAKVEAFQAAGEPVISIDAKKKELLGEYKNGGSDYGRKASRSRSTPTISRIRNWARSSPTGSTTSAPTSAMSASGSITIPGNSPSTPFASGSNR